MATRPKSTRGGRGGRNATVGNTVISTQGTTIDLSQNPLQYGANDPNVSRSRAEILAFENDHVGEPVEYNYILDKDGNLVGTHKGVKGWCSASWAEWAQAAIYTHTHPRTGDDDGYIGGSFSVGTKRGDLNVFVEFPHVQTFRAAAAEGTYSITKGPNFDSAGFLKYAQRSHRAWRGTFNKDVKVLNEQYANRQITLKEWNARARESFNRYLVGYHNDLLDGQKQYGYYYTLERR